MGFTADQSERIKNAAEFAALRDTEGYRLFVAEVRKALGSSWIDFLNARPEALPGIQAWARGVRDVLQIVDERVLDGERATAEAEQQAQADHEAAEARLQFQRQGSERRVRLGARL